jgi:hypothetical protein
MTDNPCNCSNCSNWDKFWSSCKLLFYEQSIFGEKEVIHPRIEHKNEWLLKQVGCLSHPQAPEYLNADAIKELQQLVDDPLIVPTARLCFEKAMVLMREGKS